MADLHVVQLKPTFDIDLILKCYQHVKNAQRKPAGFPGENNVGWDSVNLFSLDNTSANLLSQMPDLENELKKTKLRLRLVRFLTLEPGGVIQKHSDSFLSERIVRLHVPVITNSDVEFYLADEKCVWNPGELWYGDFSLPHFGRNNSQITRVHLVMDVTADENLLKLFPSDQIPAKLIYNINNVSSEYNVSLLKRFECTFILPEGFALPGMSYAQLDAQLEGNIRLIDKELSLFIDDQPLLKLLPVTEDKLSLIGLDQETYVDFSFNDDKVTQMSLDVYGTRIPISLSLS